MVDNAKRNYHRLKLLVRRKVRRQKKQVEDMTVQADNSLERFVFRRFNRLYSVRRFIASWVALVLFIGVGAIWQVRSLDSFYLDLEPASGGIYREGMLGNFTTSNPLFSVNGPDVVVSKLIFSGLFKLSPEGVLEPDLATEYSHDEKGSMYTVKLRQDVQWQDGIQFTSDDVVFTYELIKNSEVKSPLFTGWSQIAVKAEDAFTVSFTLPNTLGSFPYAMTNGIVPKHILENVSPADLRSSTFNTVNPIGTGPFKYVSVEVLNDSIDDRREKVTLERNADYFGDNVRIDGVTIRTFKDEETMIHSFDNREITAMVGLQTLPDEFSGDDSVRTYSTPLSSQVMIFLNNSTSVLSDVQVRKALVRATNVSELRDALSYDLVASDSPFLKSHFSYDENKVQLTYDSNEANKILDEAGWKRNFDGVREKDGSRLTLRLVSQSLSEYATIASELQKQWAEVGVSLEAVLQPEEDIQSTAIAQHDYDVLLYGISLGPDPDVFAYWHSSQFDPRIKTRLNLSEYKNTTADLALEAGRTRIDTELRKVKYVPFLDAWIADAPAIALYQPRFLFIVRGSIEGYRTGQFLSAADRFYSISDWQIRREKTVKQTVQ
ncbi:MAG TPA: peptide ABC transporter substrate-binding protein [Candidatus Saccharibacteria bacterium]|jgi:peptide/nickel transport system substrate-binding protein|nr:peptide ABC transporter substrate-binding protein [Candidatus Saccharibacteria bacterium]